jgi:hypothetical protein
MAQGLAGVVDTVKRWRTIALQKKQKKTPAADGGRYTGSDTLGMARCDWHGKAVASHRTPKVLQYFPQEWICRIEMGVVFRKARVRW